MRQANGMIRRRPREAEFYNELANAYPTTRVVFGVFWLMVFVGTVLASGPWLTNHVLLFGIAGGLVLFCRPAVPLPWYWWALAGIFSVGGMLSFLPAEWFPALAWRGRLEAAGVETGSRVVIQVRHAAEHLGLLVLTLAVGLWLAGHRPTPRQARTWALAFTLGAAFYAVLAKVLQEHWIASSGDESLTFGFFPNRNHTATYLAMGAFCGLGCALQAQRDKRFWTMLLGVVSAGICLFAIGFWSISRAGVGLVAIGGLIWLPMLGRRYLGRHGRWAAGLAGLLVVGMFVIVDGSAKKRVLETINKVVSLSNEGRLSEWEAGEEKGSAVNLDFRVPIALDTFKMIQDHPLTGVGAGQFLYVFPQYRELTIVASTADCYHPESSWLWVASELGIPAAVALLVLVVSACWQSLSALLAGRDRALRSGCWVAGVLLPIHGLFDVPCHRVILAWSSMFLITLSMRMPTEADGILKRVAAWPFRVIGISLLLVAAWFARAEWWVGTQPAVTIGQHALSEAKRLYELDLELQKAAERKGDYYIPDPGGDLMEQALGVLEDARWTLPLERRIRWVQWVIALHYDDKLDLLEDAFAADLALDPAWVGGALGQGEAWSAIDSSRTGPLWEEALRRARRIDRYDPENLWNSKNTLRRIHEFAKGKPELEALVPASE
jgi:hypothetical protein